jgi:hypothetical protein
MSGGPIHRWFRRLNNHVLRQAEWNVGLVPGPIHAFIGDDTRPRIDWVRPRSTSTYLADPFPVQENGQLHLFCEEYVRRTRKGRISHVVIDPSGQLSRPKPIIQLSTHMSYPYVFSHEERYYCVPETSQERRIVLYRCEQFPYVWREVCVLLDGIAAVDTSLVRHDNRWWMLFSNADDQENAKLFVWHAPSLMGPWEPHARNPVKTDARSARSAGRLFSHERALYRPAQDCSESYGGRVVLNRITRLSAQEFSEEVVGLIGPDRHSPYPDGLHTVCGAGDLTVVDAKRLTFDVCAMLGAVAAHAQKSLPRRVGTARHGLA